MSRFAFPLSFCLALFAATFTAEQASAHCQVPCGIYGDPARFEALLEDARTIEKAIGQINELAGTHDAQGNNQLVRWITTKEAHASNIQKVIGDYFMAQRIKADDPKYVEKLTAAHKVIVAAMKTKQTVDAANSKALVESIMKFEMAYTGEASHAAADHSGASHAEVSHADHGHSHDHDSHGHGDHDHGSHAH